LTWIHLSARNARIFFVRAQDVCPTRYDPGQEDSGGLDTASPNGVGDACECGDVNGDGVTDLVDVARLQRHDAGLESLAAPAQCPGDACDATSIGLLRQALADETPPATCAAASELACFDPFEANDARAASRYLGSHSDAGTGDSIVATLPPGDDDWFSFRLVDDPGSFEPFAGLDPAADYDVCLYIDCESSDTARGSASRASRRRSTECPAAAAPPRASRTTPSRPPSPAAGPHPGGLDDLRARVPRSRRVRTLHAEFGGWADAHPRSAATTRRVLVGAAVAGIAVSRCGSARRNLTIAIPAARPPARRPSTRRRLLRRGDFFVPPC
jgi:hypothetical protein